MKKIILFVLFIGCFSFVNGQSSKSIGLNTSYSFADKYAEWITYETPQVGLTYNYFINEKHGIISELGVHVVKLDWIEFSTITAIKEYNLNYSLHYIFKHNQFFIKSGFNAQIFNAIEVLGGKTKVPEYFQGGEDPIMFAQKTINIDKKQMRFVPELHFALGRDFYLGKVNIRVNGFVEKAFLYNDYLFYYDKSIDFGLSAGLFYELGK